ncbi:nitric oxide reductase activation protein NorD [Ketobacter sp.]|uniref:nitric oxide reductase activation protein NorD n=1 Tax=Ketobacter sp. TaxID=2083498 RepID=UPI000F1621E3|nr:VWA domain-containing protein [Ketobacter sp.]RLT95639.1 MAG: VWA domain-containing protein [Ketobacter sp.]
MQSAPVISPSLDASGVERTCSIVVNALSDGVCPRVRLMTGERRAFVMNPQGTLLQVPYPALGFGWTLRTWSTGIALQCAPSKARIAQFTLAALNQRQRAALAWVEGAVALGWLYQRWPGLVTEAERCMPDLRPLAPELDGASILERALDLAKRQQPIHYHPVLGSLPAGRIGRQGILAALQRAQARAPWSTSKRYVSPGYESIPAGGESNIKSSRLPPASRPEEDDIEIRPDQRAGVPYPEWNLWTEQFLKNHVAVLERKVAPASKSVNSPSVNLQRWFAMPTHRVMKNRLEDGSDLDVERYIDHYIRLRTGIATDARVFRDLLPAYRDVTTAVLLDGSASLSAGGGDVFKLELACADGLCQAMAQARERHGLFVFSGKSRHRVDVTCLRDFDDRYTIVPGDMGLTTGGYTRLGAPLRHLTQRLLAQASERRLLIVIGDGLISDEGYEGRYAWADSAHAVEEAEQAGVSLFYIGVGQARVDPLPDVFGPRRSTRIQQVEQLPEVLARVHRELISA